MEVGSYFGKDPAWKLFWERSQVEVIKSHVEVILGKMPSGSYFGKNPIWKLFWVKCQVEVILGKIPFEVILGKIPSGS